MVAVEWFGCGSKLGHDLGWHVLHPRLGLALLEIHQPFITRCKACLPERMSFPYFALCVVIFSSPSRDLNPKSMLFMEDFPHEDWVRSGTAHSLRRAGLRPDARANDGKRGVQSRCGAGAAHSESAESGAVRCEPRKGPTGLIGLRLATG